MAGNSSGGIAEPKDKVLIYLVLRIVWTFQSHKRFSVGVYIPLKTVRNPFFYNFCGSSKFRMVKYSFVIGLKPSMLSGGF